MSQLLLILCVLIWGTTTFLQRLSSDRMNPFLMQIVMSFGFMLFIPVALKMVPPSEFKWSWYSICLTFFATILSIIANVCLYTSLKGNQNTGSSIMLVSLYPVVTLVLSAIFLHEQFSALKITGVVLMIVGAFCLSR
jgi:EamA-like transporter family.